MAHHKYHQVNILDCQLLCLCRCRWSQAASAGCATCLCAASNSCTTSQLTSLPGCTSCRAMGAEICDRSNTWQMLLLPYTGAIEALFLAVPAVFSIQYLLRWANRGLFSTTDIEAAKTDGRWAVRLCSWVHPLNLNPGVIGLAMLYCT
eukprot:GHUV01040172.1.p1 GENE.GHUV01040172.1~~GHUV01040172.1.p1  ORF type:complete len:148 (+),score=25.78 GHUV01040172.1:692-1135(+)